MMKQQFFGVEIEMTGITREIAAKAIAEFFGTRAVYTGGTYDAWEVKDQTYRTWKIMSDSSIRTERKSGKTYIPTESKEYRVELVTPKLEYADIETLQEVVRRVRKAGAKVNESCGLHIHVDAKNHDARSLKNLVMIMYSKEDMLFKALKVHSDRQRYCKKVRETLVTELKECKLIDLNKLGDIWYKDCSESRTSHYNSTRYAALNLHNVWYRGTVEFRMFNSTLHAGEVKAYIHLALAMSAQAITQKRASDKKTTSTNEKFTFRTWLLRLGLIGEEFEHTRQHLLKNLEGDAAWRYDKSTYPTNHRAAQ